jgi:tetratricopeptide (TPR) repeat protein
MKRLTAILLLSAALGPSLTPKLVGAQESPGFQEVVDQLLQSTDFTERVELAQSLLELAERAGDPLQRFRAYGLLTQEYLGAGEAEEAHRYADLGLALAGEIEVPGESLHALLGLKAGILHDMGRTEEALEYADRAYELAWELGERRSLLASSQRLANLHGFLGDHATSLEYHLESLEVAELEALRPRLGVLNNVILTLIRMGALERALEYSDQAEELRRSVPEGTEGLGQPFASLLLNRANILRHQERFQEQIAALEEAERILEGEPHPRTRNLVTSALADGYINIGEYGKAIDYSRMAREEVDREEDSYPYAIATANLGLALSRTGRHTQGIQYLVEAREILERVQARSEALEVQGLVAEAYEASGDYQTALIEHKRFKELTDELHREQVQSELAASQNEFDLGMTRRERDLLEAQNELGELILARQRLATLFALTGLVGVIVILGLVWNRYRIKTQAFDALSVAHGKLDQAVKEVKTLQGLLPICASCKKIRDDEGLWNQMESYISSRSAAEFSHTVCPECARELYPEEVLEEALGTGLRNTTDHPPGVD